MIKNITCRVLRRLVRKDLPNKHRVSWPDGLNWLRYGVPGLLDPTNVHAMDYAILNMPKNGIAFEIGTYGGLSSCLIAWCLEQHSVNVPLVTCDEWVFEGAENGGSLEGFPHVSHDNYRNFIMNVCRMAQKTFMPNKLPRSVEMNSDIFFKKWATGENVSDIHGNKITLGGSISFAYIDGNHTFAFVKRDFENVDKYLVSGGFILFDDSADFTGSEVTKFIKSSEALKKDYNLVSRAPNYLFQKK